MLVQAVNALRCSEIISLGNDRSDVRRLPADDQEVGRVKRDVPAVFLEPDREFRTQVENRSEVISTERFKIGHRSDQAQLGLHVEMSSKLEPLLDQLAKAVHMEIENRSGRNTTSEVV